MKNLVSFITLLIFILNISHNEIMAQDDEAHDPVLDQDGNEVKTGANYYLRPVFRPGGGVTIYPPLENRTCTYGVTQLVFGEGLPVTFGNGGTDLGEVVRESTNLTIVFSFGKLFCGTAWKVDKYDEASGQYFVIAEDDGSESSINRWFQLRKDPQLGGYRFAFCPKVCEFCEQICTNVGIYVYDGVRRFALDGDFPSTFNFRKEDLAERTL